MLFNQGKVIADGSPLQLKSHLSDGAISFKSDQVDISLLQTFSHVISAKITDQRIVLTTSSTDALLGELFEKRSLCETFIYIGQDLKMRLNY